jgi:serine/threonine protein kinase
MALLITPVAECDLKMLLANPSPEQHFILRNAFGCLAAAIHYLHDHNCRHKDIKPANILVKNTKVLLSDFGTAKNWPAGERGTTTGVPGPYTAPYAAPEVVEWEARNEAADVWSLGCVFLEMLVCLILHPTDHILITRRLCSKVKASTT